MSALIFVMESTYRTCRRSPTRPSLGGDLPPDLAAFLESQRLACLLIGTERGSGFVIKAPGDEIESAPRPACRSCSATSCTATRLARDPSRCSASTTVRTIDRPPHSPSRASSTSTTRASGSDYGELARQDLVDLHFYDEALQHRLTKQIPNNLRSDIPLVLLTALRLRARIPNDRFDFDRAKADVIARTSL